MPLTAKQVVELIREHGSEASIRAVLSTSREKNLEKLMDKNKKIFAKLVDILEKKKVLRRGNVVSLICTGEGISDGE